MTHAMHRIAEQTHPGFPVTIYYAFKQSETQRGEGRVVPSALAGIPFGSGEPCWFRYHWHLANADRARSSLN